MTYEEMVNMATADEANMNAAMMNLTNVFISDEINSVYVQISATICPS